MQIRRALTLLEWTPAMLAEKALITFDEVAAALDDVGIHRLGGLQLGAIYAALHGADVGLAPAIGCDAKVGSRADGGLD